MDQHIEKYKKWQPFLLGICAALGFWAGLHMRQVERTNTILTNDTNVGFDQSQKLKDVLSFVQSKYIDSIDSDLATDLTIEKFISNLDPYSEYIPVHLMHKYSDQLDGTSRGIGIRLIAVDTQLIVSYVHLKSSAANNGISVGDYILSIDKRFSNSNSLNVDSIYNAIEMHPSDTIDIKWKNRMLNQINEQRIPLENVEQPPVTGAHTPAKDILYLKLNQLSKDSYREFMKAVEQYFDNKQCKHLIIDLRNNTGGLIYEVAFILNQLIKEKDVLMFKTSGIKIKEKEYRSTGNPFFNIEKIVVLVNSETASAAELLAAALQDLDRAVVIGSPTVGKATVLEQFNLGDGSAIRLAVSRYYTNSGRSIQKDFKTGMNTSYLGSSTWRQDSSFYSIKKKKLASHQGVIPDHLIAIGEMENPDNHKHHEMADRIIGRYYTEFKELIQNNPDNINQNLKIKQMIRDGIQKEMSTKGISSTASMVEEECKYALARWFFSDGLELRMRLLKDEHLRAAIQKMNR